MFRMNCIFCYTILCTVGLIIGETLDNGTPDIVCGSTLNIPRGYQKTNVQLQTGNGNIHNRSISSWTWAIDHEENRIPKTIHQAVCTFTYCIKSNSKPNEVKLDEKLLSVPVYQNVLVLNLVKSLNCYWPSFISVAVGCTCVKHREA